MQKKNIIYFVVFMTLFSLALTALPAMATQGGPRGGPPMSQEEMQERMEARQERMRILLDLSEVQHDLLQQHRTEHREKMQTIMEATRAVREQIRTELQNPDLDMNRLDQLRAEQRELCGQKVDLRIEGILGVREILTAAQFTKFQALSPPGPRHGAGPVMCIDQGMHIHDRPASPPMDE